MKHNQKQLLTADAINNLKRKVIKDYEDYVKKLYKGYQNSYDTILDEISFIQTYKDINNQKLTYEYYINYGL